MTALLPAQPAAGAAAASAAALLWKDMQMGGTTLAMDRMHEGMTHRPSPAISPDAAAGTCTTQCGVNGDVPACCGWCAIMTHFSIAMRTGKILGQSLSS